MANEENLIPYTSDQSREEAKKNGRKGGIASGVAKAKRKQLKELANAILDNKVDDELMLQEVKRRFPEIDPEDVTYGFVLLLKQYHKAKAGDGKAFEILRDTAGQKPVERQEIEFGGGGNIEIKIDGEDVE